MSTIGKQSSDEPDLHKIFDRMMERFDEEPDRDMTPQIDHLDQFLYLYATQGWQPWLQYYELSGWELIRFIYGGSEKAYGLDPLSEQFTHEELTAVMGKFSAAMDDPKLVKTELMSEDIKLRAAQVILASRCFQISNVCWFQYKAPISALIQSAREGSADSFLCLVKLDSTFLYSDYGRQMVIQAELRDDHDFKRGLVDALEPDPKFWSLEGKRNHYVFLTLFSLGDYADRSDREWADFLAAHDFEQYCEVNNVRMQRNRYNLTRLKRE